MESYLSPVNRTPGATSPSRIPASGVAGRRAASEAGSVAASTERPRLPRQNPSRAKARTSTRPPTTRRPAPRPRRRKRRANGRRAPRTRGHPRRAGSPADASPRPRRTNHRDDSRSFGSLASSAPSPMREASSTAEVISDPVDAFAASRSCHLPHNKNALVPPNPFLSVSSPREPHSAKRARRRASRRCPPRTRCQLAALASSSPAHRGARMRTIAGARAVPRGGAETHDFGRGGQAVGRSTMATDGTRLLRQGHRRGVWRRARGAAGRGLAHRGRRSFVPAALHVAIRGELTDADSGAQRVVGCEHGRDAKAPGRRRTT